MTLMIKRALKKFPGLYGFAQRLYPFVSVIPALLSGRRESLDHLRSTWSLLNKSVVVLGRPVSITIEPTNTCNLRCPVCETGNGELSRAKCQMTLDEFRIIIGKIGKHTNTLMLYFMGETFLNTEAYLMIRAAKESGTQWVSTCTNGEMIDPEQLVMSGLDEVSFQIGGMTQETHEIYRVSGKLERVLRNLGEVVRLKRHLKARLHIICGMILMRHNEHEVELFRKTMSKIGVDEAVIIDPCVRTIEQAKRYLPKDERHWYYDPQAFKAGILRPRHIPKNSCHWIYYSLAIHVNGDVVPCCRDANGKFVMGNLLEQSFDDIWNGDKFKSFRKRVATDQSKISICELCSGYPASSMR